MPNCRAADWVLRLSLARRRASALKASSYLRRLSGDAPLGFAAITEEIYVLLLSVIPRPPHYLGKRTELTKLLKETYLLLRDFETKAKTGDNIAANTMMLLKSIFPAYYKVK